VRYLQRFWEFLPSTLLRLDWVPSAVAADERTSRYIFDKEHFNEAQGRVKYTAFMPAKKTTDISVYRTKDCREWRIWAIGRYFVERRRPDNVVLRARGDLPAMAYVQQSLRVTADRKPHPRHAIVAYWPNEESEQRVKAIGLAHDALLLLNPRAPKRRPSGTPE